MRRRAGADVVHALEITGARLSLLVPSACIAEVAPWIEPVTVPAAASWVLGAVNWRQRPVAVVSFEGLIRAEVAPARGARLKLVVFYPPPGAKPWQFFALASAGDPQPRQIDSATVSADAGDLPNHPCIAGGVNVDGRVALIPDLEALRRVMFP